MRRRIYETGHTEMLTRDKKNIIARTFVVWRIGDPLTFVQAIGAEVSDSPLVASVTVTIHRTLPSAASIDTTNRTMQVEVNLPNKNAVLLPGAIA